MFRLVSQSLSPITPNAYTIKLSLTTSLRLLQTLALNPTPTPTNPPIHHHPTVSYLTTKCGLPLDSALSASKHLTFTTTDNADSVLDLFKSYDFTQPQIANLITKSPILLQYNPKTLKPKFEFCENLGLSRQDTTKFLSSNPTFMRTSLSKQIVPTVGFLKAALITDEAVLYAVKRWPSVLYQNYRLNMEPNFLTLQAHGARGSEISRLLMKQPRVFFVRNELFEDRVRRVKELGICPQSLAYFRCIRVMLSLSHPLWRKKVDVFKSFGWSDEDVIAAFKVQPHVMCCSEKKIVKLMKYFSEEFGFKPTDIARCPNLLLMSLEKKIIPRVSVLQILVGKSLIEKDLNIASILILKKKLFDENFVIKYREAVPEIVDVYQGKAEKPLGKFISTPGLKLRTSRSS